MIPHEDRKPEDYRRAAGNALFAAQALAGQPVDDSDFLARMTHSDELVDHDGETCGMCLTIILGATVARDMIAAGETGDLINKWQAEHQRRWHESKFFKLWQEEVAAGRDPHKAFEERGWEP